MAAVMGWIPLDAMNRWYPVITRGRVLPLDIYQQAKFISRELAQWVNRPEMQRWGATEASRFLCRSFGNELVERYDDMRDYDLVIATRQLPSRLLARAESWDALEGHSHVSRDVWSFLRLLRAAGLSTMKQARELGARIDEYQQRGHEPVADFALSVMKDYNIRITFPDVLLADAERGTIQIDVE